MERFHTVAELLEALHAFKDRYNREWLVAKHDHRSPAAARALLSAEGQRDPLGVLDRSSKNV